MSRVFFLGWIYLFWAFCVPAQTVVEPQVGQLLNELIHGLQLGNIAEAEKAVIPCLHFTMLDAGGTRLNKDVFEYSFKKAHESAFLYQYPVQVVRIRERTTTTIGTEPHVESGRVVEYYLAKKSKDDGLPAPVQVFFPSQGGKPKVLYLGGL